MHVDSVTLQTVTALHGWNMNYISFSHPITLQFKLSLSFSWKLCLQVAIQCVSTQSLSCLSSSRNQRWHKWTCDMPISSSLKFWLAMRHLHHSLILIPSKNLRVKCKSKSVPNKTTLSLSLGQLATPLSQWYDLWMLDVTILCVGE